jgi:hypothetical protein
MRVNFNLETSLINDGGLSLPGWLDKVFRDFLESWDLHPESHEVISWAIDRKDGLQDFIKWMQAQGWKVAYYEMAGLVSGTEPLSFGMEFAEDCQRLMTARLSQ